MIRHYVVQCQPQREPLAVQELRNQGFTTFFPVIQGAPKVRRGVYEAGRLSPLFPKYLFVPLDLEAEDRWSAINGTRGVVRLMSMNGKPSPMPIAAMTRLLAAGETLVHDTAILPFNINDSVEFLSGAFAGQKGIVQLCTRDRVTLLLDLLGRQTTVKVAPTAVRYVGP